MSPLIGRYKLLHRNKTNYKGKKQWMGKPLLLLHDDRQKSPRRNGTNLTRCGVNLRYFQNIVIFRLPEANRTAIRNA